MRNKHSFNTDKIVTKALGESKLHEQVRDQERHAGSRERESKFHRVINFCTNFGKAAVMPHYA